MALPIGKQPEAQTEHSGNNADLRTNFIDSINSCRPVYDRGTRYPYLRGRGRNAHIRAWILWEDQEPPANASPRDHLLRGTTFSRARASRLIEPELFPNYPWNGMRFFEYRDLKPDTYYLTSSHICRAFDGRLQSLMPLDAIQVQLHQHAVKLVWAHGTSDKYDIRRRAFALERNLTADEWVSFAYNSNALVRRLIELASSAPVFPRNSLIVGIIRSFSGSIGLTIRQISSGAEPFHAALGEAVKRLYTFEEVEPLKTWDSYQDFLNSPEWQAKREAVRKRSGGWCESCRVAGVLKRAVHVHHVHYEKAWGQEETSDLLHLCEDHHRLAHGNVP